VMGEVAPAVEVAMTPVPVAVVFGDEYDGGVEELPVGDGVLDAGVDDAGVEEAGVVAGDEPAVAAHAQTAEAPERTEAAMPGPADAMHGAAAEAMAAELEATHWQLKSKAPQPWDWAAATKQACWERRLANRSSSQDRLGCDLQQPGGSPRGRGLRRRSGH
jgi:hypothetical protein